jgi:RecB family exonuclease
MESRLVRTDRERSRLSFSRLNRFAECALSFRLHYVDQLPSEPSEAATFGAAIHAALEELVLEHVREERRDALSEEHATQHWRQAFADAGLRGLGLFEEGLELVRGFVREQGVLDAHDVLAIEEAFQIRIGEFDVVGVLDRVDRVDEQTIRIVDYKSNRLLYSQGEVDTSLQMSLYQLAARELWPWATRVQSSFWMLRHGVHQEAERTPDELDATRHYVQALGRALAEATEFPARLNANCAWCDHRRHCATYAEALTGKRAEACEDLTDLEAVAREREQVAHVAKAAYARRDQLDKILRAHLQEHEELVLAGVRYAMFRVEQRAYPLEPTIALLRRETGLEEADLRARLTVVDNKSIDALIKERSAELGRSRARLLKVELDALATKTHSARLWAKAVASRPRAADSPPAG